MTDRRSDGRTVAWISAWVGPSLVLVLIALALWPARTGDQVIRRVYAHAPSALERDSLAALSTIGARVSWSGSVTPVAAELETDLSGTLRAAVSAPAGTHVALRDALGMLDSGTVASWGAAFQARGVTGRVLVSAGREALGDEPVGVARRSIVVLGPAGWESRYLVEAVEAAGIAVSTRIRVGPRTFITQGRPLPLDTARHAVVIVLGALDTVAARDVRAFVRSGGGLVLASGATGFGDIAPGRFGPALRPPASLSLPTSPEQLVSRPIQQLNAGATALGPGAAARRAGAGRVVQVANEDSWRLALASDVGREAHARLWLGAIATASMRDVARPKVDDEVAPLAQLVASLGPPAAAGRPGLPTIDWGAVIAILTFLVLVGEWGVRRIRGRA